jgi:hypothetical protein
MSSSDEHPATPTSSCPLAPLAVADWQNIDFDSPPSVLAQRFGDDPREAPPRVFENAGGGGGWMMCCPAQWLV